MMADAAQSEVASYIRNRIRELRRVRAGDLVPNPKNWRRHPRAQRMAVRALLGELGYVDALLVRELPDGRLLLLNGHLRAQLTPEAIVPVLVLDLTEEEADKVLLTFDPLAAMAEADADRIKDLLETVRADSDAVAEVLRRVAGAPLWHTLHPDEVQAVEVSQDRADELRQKWRVAAGQLWHAGRHRLICGDCRDPAVAARLWAESEARARMLWTDPAYGVRYGDKNRYLNRTDRGNRIQTLIPNDDLSGTDAGALFRDGLSAAVRYCAPGAAAYATVPAGPSLLYFIEGFAAAGFRFTTTLVWVKDRFVIGMGDYQHRHELILYGWLATAPHYFTADRTQDSVFEVNRPRVSDLHPTTKPVELIAQMVANSSRPGEVVYDPFLGSGSTLVAAHQLGRVGYGCELDPGYTAVALERLAMLGLEPAVVPGR